MCSSLTSILTTTRPLKYLKEHGYTVDYLIYSPYDRRYGDTSVTLDEWNEFNSLLAPTARRKDRKERRGGGRAFT